LALALEKNKKSNAIRSQMHIALDLNQLGMDNYSLACASTGILKLLPCIIVNRFCQAIINHIEPLIVPMYALKNMATIVAKFKAVQP
jgi:hypothetical protein